MQYDTTHVSYKSYKYTVYIESNSLVQTLYHYHEVERRCGQVPALCRTRTVSGVTV